MNATLDMTSWWRLGKDTKQTEPHAVAGCNMHLLVCPEHIPCGNSKTSGKRDHGAKDSMIITHPFQSISPFLINMYEHTSPLQSIYHLYTVCVCLSMYNVFLSVCLSVCFVFVSLTPPLPSPFPLLSWFMLAYRSGAHPAGNLHSNHLPPPAQRQLVDD